MSNMAHLTLSSMKDKVSPAEWKARVDLAACYRLVAHYEMSDMMANHISAAVPCTAAVVAIGLCTPAARSSGR